MTYSRNLKNLLLRNIQNDSDKERFADFNAIYNNPSEGATCACLLNHHPTASNSDYWMVEDQTRGDIVSTTCLIPWESRFCEINLRIAQLEMVLTHPGYRGRGLVRFQIENFLQAAKGRGYDLSIIWGIPYFYRQFGFSYVIEGNTFETLQLGTLVQGKDVVFTRPANVNDIPFLVSYYERMIDGLGFSIKRTPEYWEYLLQHAQRPVEMVTEAQAGGMIGYVILKTPACPEGEAPILILEHSLPDISSALALLRHLQRPRLAAPAAGSVHIAWPETTHLIQAARGLGSQVIRGGQWLLHITDLKRLLEKMTPIFERRLESSTWQRATTRLVINLYRQAYLLRFEEGKMLPVEALGFVDTSMGADGGDLCISPEAFVRLLTGFRGLDELYDAWPDTIVKPSSRSLVDVLFPCFPGYLSTPFHYLGM
jgi:GNAT superfamily N-acetyltransferase